MDTQNSSTRTLKPVQEQEVAEDWRWPRNETELDVLQRLWNKGARKRRKRGRTRHTVQTVSKRQATLQWKSTCECGAETPEEREMKNSDTAL